MDALLVVTNAGAGSSDAEQLDRAVATLRSADFEVEVAQTGGDGRLEAALDRRGDRHLVVAGGDGSVHFAVARLHQRGELPDTVLGLLPMGTGNDFARGTGVPLDIAAATQVIMDRHVRGVDLLVDDENQVVVNNVHLGVGADASRYGARWKRRLGRAGYPIGVIQAAFADPYRLRVTVDDEVVADGSRPVLEVSIGNGATVGGGVALNPDADPDDGRLDVLVAFATGPRRRLTYALDLARARHPQRRDVTHRQATSVEVGGEAVYLSADGEIAGPITRRSWRLLRNSLQMLLPR